MLLQEFSVHGHVLPILLVFLTTAIISIVPVLGYRDDQFIRHSEDEAWHPHKPLHERQYLSSPEECSRVCRKDEPPKICYYHFTLELYTTMGGACQTCTPNATNTGKCQCVQADGVEKAFLAINRMLPGPAIHVCEGDTVVIDVKNQMEGMDASIHWHGIYHRGTQYFDGVPMVTQCPITQGDTFRYEFRTKNNAGTHFYHSHAGTHKIDGIWGALTIRQVRSKDPHGHLYQHDSPAHEILIADWMHELSAERMPGRVRDGSFQNPDNVLINGKGQFTDPNSGNKTKTPLAYFQVKEGHTYRFREVTATGTNCPFELTIEGHSLTVIASDGQPVKPHVVSTIISLSGETYDFLIHANRPVGAYWLQVRGLNACAARKIQQLAILRYSNGPCTPSSPAPTYDKPLPHEKVLNPLDGLCHKPRPDAVCMSQLRNVNKVDKRILHPVPDVKIFLSIKFFTYPAPEMFKPHTYTTYTSGQNGTGVVATLNDISYIAPTSPPLSQFTDISPESFCKGNKKPEKCLKEKDKPCYCTHKEDIPLNSIVEVIVVDETGVANLTHPFHLHGYAFNLIGMGRSPEQNVSRISIEHCIDLDRRGLLNRHLESPPAKDTIGVPNNGYIIYRFKADNPGFWFVHCHFAYHLSIGMNVIFHVGRHSDLPPVPKTFPRCGDFLPPIIGFDHPHDEY